MNILNIHAFEHGRHLQPDWACADNGNLGVGDFIMLIIKHTSLHCS